MKFVFIQAIGFLGTGLFFLSYQFKKNQTLFRIQFVSYLCYTVHFLLLGAITGGISYILNAIRSFCLGSNHAVLRGKGMCTVICLLQVATLVLTWEGWLSVLPVAANIVATVGGYTHNGRTIRLVAMLVNSPLWIVYDIAVGSWAGVIDELITEVSALVSILRYGWKALDTVEN
ncbi:MAG: YgjV family protein [Ruminococcaceae bacterium]|nr:YgjV family protein [Oscillospiraceae bacterium]